MIVNTDIFFPKHLNIYALMFFENCNIFDLRKPQNTWTWLYIHVYVENKRSTKCLVILIWRFGPSSDWDRPVFDVTFMGHKVNHSQTHLWSHEVHIQEEPPPNSYLFLPGFRNLLIYLNIIFYRVWDIVH